MERNDVLNEDWKVTVRVRENTDGCSGSGCAIFSESIIRCGAYLQRLALGYFRVKRERRDFKVRLLPGLTELKRLVGGVMALCNDHIGSDCGGRIGCRSGVARTIFASCAYRFAFILL